MNYGMAKGRAGEKASLLFVRVHAGVCDVAATWQSVIKSKADVINGISDWIFQSTVLEVPLETALLKESVTKRSVSEQANALSDGLSRGT
jgi:hypothetical protein